MAGDRGRYGGNPKARARSSIPHSMLDKVRLWKGGGEDRHGGKKESIALALPREGFPPLPAV